jgi:hypothetical protein
MHPQLSLPILSPTHSKSSLSKPSARPQKPEPCKTSDFPEVHLFSSELLSSHLNSFSSSQNKGESRADFFDSLRKLPLLSKRQTEEASPTIAYLNECHRQSLSPIPLGLAGSDSNSISVQNFSMGDNYAKAFSKGIKRLKNLEKLNLCANSLSPRGTKVILSKVTLKPLKELNLKDNRMNIKSVTPLISLIQKQNATLRYLNLENTRLSQKDLGKLCEALGNDRILNFLGLAMNSLGAEAAVPIKSMLVENHYLKKLDLHWNNLKDRGTLLVFEGLSKNDSLKELDLSWNSIGNSREKGCIKSISNCFAKIQGLAHLDLSFNSLTGEECVELGRGLEANHDILGIHMMGNEGIVDSQGFVLRSSGSTHFEQSHLFKRIFQEVKKVKLSLKRPKIKCWICEEWVEMKFVWNLNQSESSSNGDMFIHLECDEFQPDLMTFVRDSYEIRRVVPQGEVRFFFTKNNFLLRSKEYDFHELSRPEEHEIKFSEKFHVSLTLHVINKTIARGTPCDYRNPFKSLPRNPRFIYSPAQEKMERVNWSISRSLFKDYKFLNDELVAECLEFDWNQSKLMSWVKVNEQAGLKDLLRGWYFKIIETFRFLGSQSGNEFFTVGSNVLNEFLNQCNVFDSKYDQSDLGVNWNSVLVSKEKKQPYNPGNALVRYQFTELLVRIAYDRYVRTKKSPDIIKGFSMFLEEKIGHGLSLNNSQIWREQEYLHETVDVVLKSFKPIIGYIFKTYSGKKSLPSQKPFMSIEEFKQLCLDAKIISEKLAARDLEGCFVLSMIVQVDELFEKKHIEMTFVEFLEALCRVCWFLNTETANHEEVEMSEFKKIGIHVDLKEKIEKAMWNLYHLCPKQLQDNFSFPNQQVYKSFMYKFERMPTTIKETYKDMDDDF